MIPTRVPRLCAVIGAGVLIVLAQAGCSSVEKDQAAILEAMASNNVVAVVNGTPVMALDAADVLRARMAQYLAASKTIMPPDIFEKERRTVVDRLVAEELMKQRVACSTVIVDEAMMDAEIALHITNTYHGDGAAFNTVLAKAGVTFPMLRDSMRYELRKMMTMNADMRPPDVTTARSLAYYRSHSNEFVVPESVTVRHILLKCGAETPDLKQTQMVQRLQAIRREIASGITFEDAARKYSECPSARGGGMLGTVTAGDTRISELFLRAALAAPLSNVSRVAATELGFHLLYVTERQVASTASFKQVRASLTRWLVEKHRADAMKEWIASLREKATIEYP